MGESYLGHLCGILCAFDGPVSNYLRTPPKPQGLGGLITSTSFPKPKDSFLYEPLKPLTEGEDGMGIDFFDDYDRGEDFDRT